jgi:hypothetical protein
MGAIRTSQFIRCGFVSDSKFAKLQLLTTRSCAQNLGVDQEEGRRAFYILIALSAVLAVVWLIVVWFFELHIAHKLFSPP